jgi:hypothetical protein
MLLHLKDNLFAERPGGQLCIQLCISSGIFTASTLTSSDKYAVSFVNVWSLFQERHLFCVLCMLHLRLCCCLHHTLVASAAARTGLMQKH